MFTNGNRKMTRYNVGLNIYLVKSVKSGHEVRCVTDKKYAFPLQNVAINSQGVGFVSGQNVDSISIKRNDNLIQLVTSLAKTEVISCRHSEMEQLYVARKEMKVGVTCTMLKT